MKKTPENPPLEAAEAGAAEPVAPTVVGWREWVALPELGVSRIKAKVDTGARTSALHAINIHFVARHGKVYVRFDLHPKQRDSKRLVSCEALLVEERHVTDSGGTRTLRPVIETLVDIGGRVVPAELTLVSRDAMGFRMLIGRQALRRRFLVHPNKSFMGKSLGTKKKKKKKKKAVE